MYIRKIFVTVGVIAALTAGAQFPGGDVKIVGVGTKSKHEKVKGDSYDEYGLSLYECVYDYTIKSADKNGREFSESVNTILQLSPSMAKYSDYTAYHVDSLIMSSGDAATIKERLDKANMKFTAEIYQNIPDGKVTYLDVITPSYVEYEEELAPFDWIITGDTATVCGYPCVKATCSYGGRDWEAWYAEDIPSTFGPWKFAGLPGLIMKVRDTGGVHTMTATSFRQATGAIGRKRNVMVQRTSRDKFIRMKRDFERDPMNAVSVETISEISVSKGGGMLINGVPMPQRENGYTPIELQ